ncbi:hypothetical protein C6P40_004560, partial [Pichia californica]
NWGIHAPHDEFTLNVKEIVENNLARPIKMLFTEPILFLISIYNAFIYGMLYLFLEAYPIVFAEGYGMVAGVAELPYFGLVIGQLLGGLYCIYSERSYNKKMREAGGKIIPENRLPPMIAGGIAFPIGLLWFCWTGNYHKTVHWIVPTVSGLFTGFGLIAIFNPSMNYIIDAYLIFAASAMAANSFLRSAFGAVFPLFATFMFLNMGTNWAGLLLGLFAAVLILCPVCFLKWETDIMKTTNKSIPNISNNNLPSNSSSSEETDADVEKFNGDLEVGSMYSDDIVRLEAHSNLSREISRKLTNADAIKIDTSTPLPKMGKDRNYPPMLPDISNYTVAFD